MERELHHAGGRTDEAQRSPTRWMRRHALERCEERAGPLPAFVKAELEGFAG